MIKHNYDSRSDNWLMSLIVVRIWLLWQQFCAWIKCFPYAQFHLASINSHLISFKKCLFDLIVFFSIPQLCQPVMPDGTDCSNPINFGRYIEDFRCLNTNITDRLVKEMRLSFPSGHSSFSVYTMVYCAVC